MTVDHLPPSIADLAEPAAQADDAPVEPAEGAACRVEPVPGPAPATTPEIDENWQRNGFGSFP